MNVVQLSDFIHYLKIQVSEKGAGTSEPVEVLVDGNEVLQAAALMERQVQFFKQEAAEANGRVATEYALLKRKNEEVAALKRQVEDCDRVEKFLADKLTATRAERDAQAAMCAEMRAALEEIKFMNGRNSSEYHICERALSSGGSDE